MRPIRSTFLQCGIRKVLTEPNERPSSMKSCELKWPLLANYSPGERWKGRARRSGHSATKTSYACLFCTHSSRPDGITGASERHSRTDQELDSYKARMALNPNDALKVKISRKRGTLARERIPTNDNVILSNASLKVDTLIKIMFTWTCWYNSHGTVIF